MKKTSTMKASETFMKKAEAIEAFLSQKNLASFSDEQKSWAHGYAIIRLYRDFEDLLLRCLAAAINNNTEYLSETTGVDFPKHLKYEVCQYIIVGDGYFSFRDRPGLIKTFKKYLPDDHNLVGIIRKPEYKEALEQLSALRNHAAHGSAVAKKRALKAIGQKRMKSSGAWLKIQNRFGNISSKLKELASELHDQAPY